jgi:hypothetical protein
VTHIQNLALICFALTSVSTLLWMSAHKFRVHPLDFIRMVIISFAIFAIPIFIIYQ